MALNDSATQLRTPLLNSTPRNNHDTHALTSKRPSISIKVVVQAYLSSLISRICHTGRARRASPKSKQPRSKFCGLPFRAPHTFPTAIILRIADLLDEASLLALRHTNRHLFSIVSPAQAQSKYCGPLFRAFQSFPTEIVLHMADSLEESSFLALRHTNRHLFSIVSPTQAQSEYCGPLFRAFQSFPTEIILHIADLLDEPSLLALRHTNRNLFYIISPTPDQISRAREARYVIEFIKITEDHNKDSMAFCTSCQELRPLASFSVSEIMMLERLQEASCLRHNKLWICPHVTYDFESIMELPYKGAFICRTDESDCLSYFGFRTCDMVFSSLILESESERWPSQYWIETEIRMFIVEHLGGPDMRRDIIQRYLTKDRVQKAAKNIHAPICDHYLLSDEQVHNKYDPTDIDLNDHTWHRIDVPDEHMRTVRKSDGSCSFCQALGLQTKFRFVVTSCGKNSSLGTTAVALSAVLVRSLGAYEEKTLDQLDAHRRCYAVTERRLAKFRETWDRICTDVPEVSPVEPSRR
jgi:hypothetical protein